MNGFIHFFIVCLCLSSSALAGFSNHDSEQRAQSLSSPIWMRGFSATWRDLCAGAEEECFQLSYSIDPYQNDEMAASAIKSGFAKDNLLKTKLVGVSAGEIPKSLNRVLERARIRKIPQTRADYRAVIAQLNQLKKDYRVTAFEAIGFSGVTNQMYLILMIRNPRYDMGEALILGAGAKEYWGGSGTGP